VIQIENLEQLARVIKHKIKTNMVMNPHLATLTYLSEIPTELQWKDRGIKGHIDNESIHAELIDEVNKAIEYIYSGKGKKSLYNFLTESAKIYAKLIDKKKDEAIEKLPNF